MSILFGTYPAAVATILMWLGPRRNVTHRAKRPCATCTRLPAMSTLALDGSTVPNTLIRLSLTTAPSVGAVSATLTARGDDLAPPHPGNAVAASNVAAAGAVACPRAVALP